jgi:Bacterial protein of unknown function (DUF899)
VWSPPADVRGPFDARAATTGTGWATYTRERPGMSAFALQDGVLYHTYSAYTRGLDVPWGMYQWLDRAPRGRNEARGPDDPLNWFRRHDEYHHANGPAITGPGSRPGGVQPPRSPSSGATWAATLTIGLPSRTAVTRAPHAGLVATFRDGSRSADSAGRSRHGEHPDAQGARGGDAHWRGMPATAVRPE